MNRSRLASTLTSIIRLTMSCQIFPHMSLLYLWYKFHRFLPPFFQGFPVFLPADFFTLHFFRGALMLLCYLHGMWDRAGLRSCRVCKMHFPSFPLFLRASNSVYFYFLCALELGACCLRMEYRGKFTLGAARKSESSSFIHSIFISLIRNPGYPRIVSALIRVFPKSISRSRVFAESFLCFATWEKRAGTHFGK